MTGRKGTATAPAELIERVQRRVAAWPEEGAPTTAEVVALIRDEAGVISDVDVFSILRRLRNDSVGAGPLEELLAVAGVTDVLVNGAESVWFDRGRGLERAHVELGSEEQVRALATRLALACGRRLDDAQPFADGRLLRDDGTLVRVHALLGPLSESGTCISLRVLRQATLTLHELTERKTVSSQVADVLRRIVAQRRAFLVVGGTGSGKTTMLSALLSEVAHSERILCIEDTAELHPQHPNVVNLVARSANVEGTGEIGMTDLLRQALRMRPDRIVVGEIRGAEVVDLLAALNTGHEGGAGTIHANALTEVPARLEALAALGGLDRAALHAQLAAAIDIVLVMRREGGIRVLVEIGVVVGNPVSVVPVWRRDGGAENPPILMREEVPEWVRALFMESH